MMTLTQSHIALLIGFCIATGINIPPMLPFWDGTNTASFDAGKALAGNRE